MLSLLTLTNLCKTIVYIKLFILIVFSVHLVLYNRQFLNSLRLIWQSTLWLSNLINDTLLFYTAIILVFLRTRFSLRLEKVESKCYHVTY